jgi:large subunit ribosomal protein L29
MATAAEISEYDTEELERQLGETRRELFNLRFQLATGQLDNFSRINHIRKDVARMMTELRIREIGEAEGLVPEELPVHLAAARRRSKDQALGRDRSTASERRAAAKADAEAAEVASDPDALDEDPDELAEEVADDDGMALPGDEVDDDADAHADDDAEAHADDADEDTDDEDSADGDDVDDAEEKS